MKKHVQTLILFVFLVGMGGKVWGQVPVAWWQAEANAIDSIGTNNGAIESSFSYIPGETGQAFSFAGGTVSIPDAANLDPVTNLTVQVWVKGTAPTSIRYVFAKGGGAAGASYAFYTAANNGLAFWVDVPADPVNFGLIISPSVDPSLIWDGNWHQATGTYDGVAVHLYIDGVEVGSGTSYTGPSGSESISYSNPQALVFGNFGVGGGFAWPGSLDEVKLFDRALTADEVSDTFTNSTSTAATNSLASWWRADGNALDSWGVNNGTVNAQTISFFPGKSGQGFLSAGGSVVVPNSAVLEPANITVQAWVKSTTPGTFKYILSKARPGFASYALYTGGSGGVAFFASIGGGNLIVSPSADPSVVWNGAWHQVTGLYDGTALHLYLDGLEVGAGTSAPGGIDYTNSFNGGSFVIGNDPTLGFAMSGGIDEVKIYDQALTPQQIVDSFKDGKLVSWWRGETNVDDSVGSNNGSLQGSVSYGASRLAGAAFKLSGGAVVIPGAISLAPANITVEALVNAAPPGTNKYLISKSLSSANSSYAFFTGPSGGLSFYVTVGSGTFISPAIDPSLIWDGYYHFVTGTFDGQTVRLFVDGTEIGSGTPAAGSIQYGTGFSSGELLVGDFSDTLTSSNFVGLVDDVKIFSAALSAADIQADAFYSIIITSQPQSISAAPGSSASFSVGALPTGLNYQWSQNGTNLAGATQATLVLTNIQAFQAGAYRVGISVGNNIFTTNNLLGGKAFHLPGGVVDVPRDVSLEPANQITIQTWVRKTGTPGGFKYILDKSLTGGVGSYAIYTGGSGGAFFYVNLGGSLVLSPDAGASIWDGNWHQLTGVYDGSFVRMYVDGQQVGGGSDTFGGGTITYTGGTVNGDLNLGDFSSRPSTLNFGGDLDEAKVFDHGLSDSDVADTYANLNGVASTNGLISWWKAEGNALDAAGSNNGQVFPLPGSVLSDSAFLTLTLSAVSLTNPHFASGSFQATLVGPDGQSYVVERANTLSNPIWTPIATNTVPFTFTDIFIPDTNRFYRGKSQQ